MYTLMKQMFLLCFIRPAPDVFKQKFTSPWTFPWPSPATVPVFSAYLLYVLSRRYANRSKQMLTI
jgi:hypothetical protein